MKNGNVNLQPRGTLVAPWSSNELTDVAPVHQQVIQRHSTVIKSIEKEKIARKRFLHRERMRLSKARLSSEARERLRARRRRQYAERIARETEEEKKFRKAKLALKRKQYSANETPQQRQRRLDRVRRRAKLLREQFKKANKKSCEVKQGARTSAANSSNPTVASSKSRRKQITPKKSKEATIVFQFENLTNPINDSSNDSTTGSHSESCPSLSEIPAFNNIFEPEQEDSLFINNNVVFSDNEPSRFAALSFFADDEKVEFYTGITSLKKLCSLFHSLIREMGAQGQNELLPRFEQFCLAMMNLRLNLQPEDFSVLFHLPEFEVSQCIDRFISSMFAFLVPTYWPKYVERQNDAILPQFFTNKRIGKLTFIVDLVKVRLKNELTLNYFVAFSIHGLVSYVSSGYPESFQQDIEKWELLGLLKHLSYGEKILVRISNQIKLYECDKKKRLNRTLLNMNQEICEELNYWTQKILDPFKRRFAVFCHGQFTPVQSLTPLNYKVESSSSHMTLKIDQIVKVCCMLHNSNPLSPIFKSLLSFISC